MKKKKRRLPRNTRRPAKQHWVETLTPYRTDMFVCTGFSVDDIVREQKKLKPADWVLKWIEKNKETWKDIIERDCAFLSKEGTRGIMLLRLREFEDTWEYWETLIHELSHAVDGISQHRAFTEESEAKAYLHEHLFRVIRRKLLGYDKTK